MFYNIKDKLINTSEGFKNFKGVQVVRKSGRLTVWLKTGQHVICSLNHRLMTSSGWKPALELKHDDVIIGRNFTSQIYHIEYEAGEFDFYDIVGVENSEFYSNDILSHNCEFLGSSNTLISPEVLRRLVYKPPLNSNEYFKLFYEPRQTGLYIIMVDVSRGLGGDYSAFIVYDITEAPYKVAATYRNNNISPLLFPEVIYNTAVKYFNAHVLIETNDIGQQVADILHEELEYENIIYTSKSPKGSVEVSQGFGGTAVKGLRTTKSTKKIGCNNFKALVENDKVELNDIDLISELYRFVSNGNTYEAEDGNDDLAMCGVLFGWTMTQPFIKEITNLDIRRRLVDEKQRMLDEEITPFGIIYDGQSIEDQPVVYVDNFARYMNS